MAHNLKRKILKKETIVITKEKASSKNSTLNFTKSAFSHLLKIIENTWKPIYKQQIVKKIVPDYQTGTAN